MRREFFAEQIKLLSEAFDEHLTPQRVEALWEKFRYFTEDVARKAVRDLMTGSRYPSRTEIDRAFYDEQERAQEETTTRQRAENVGPWKPDFESGTRCPAERARFYCRLQVWLFNRPRWASRQDVEDLIASAQVGAPGTMLEDPPDDWRSFIIGAWSQLQAGTIAGGLARTVASATAPEEAPPPVRHAEARP